MGKEDGRWQLAAGGDPPIATLARAAVAFAGTPFAGSHRLVIRSIAAKQRPRR